MNGYERIVTALQGKEPDQVPVWEWYIDPKVIEGLCPGCDSFELVEQMDLDGILSPGGKHGVKHSDTSEETYVDRWGVHWGRSAEAYAPIEGAIKSMSDLERYVPPDPYDEYMIEDVREAAKRFKGERFITYHSRADFMSAADLRGFSELLMDFRINPELAHGVLEIVSDYYCTLNRRAIEAGADAVTLADDWAYNLGPLMSPTHFREFVLPYFQRAVDTVKDAGGYVIKHTDGKIWRIIDMAVEAGIDAINPIEPAAGMDIGEVKKKYGSRVCIIGNIDCGHTLSVAPVEQVVREVKDSIAKAGLGGGYIMMSSNSLHSSVKPENYRAMVETTRTYGKYPLDMAVLR